MNERVEGKRRAPRTAASRTLRSADPRGDAQAVSTGEAAAELGVTERTVRRAIARGELAAVRRGGAFRIARQELARYAAQAEQAVEMIAPAATTVGVPTRSAIIPMGSDPSGMKPQVRV